MNNLHLGTGANKRIAEEIVKKNIDANIYLRSQIAKSWSNSHGIEVGSKPVSVEEFIDSEEYLNLKDVIYPGVKETLIECFATDNNGKRKYHEIILSCGQGYGKGFISSIGIARLTYEMSLFVNPQDNFGLAPDSKLAVMNMGVNQTQSKNVIFSDIKARIEHSSFFREKFIYNPKIQSSLQFPKGIHIIPGSSSETNPLGYNLYAVIMDEVSYWPVIQNSKKWIGERDRDVAINIYDAVIKRLKTRFMHFYMLFAISSARYQDDFIERKFEEAKINNKILAIRKNTWDNRRPKYYNGKTFSDPVCGNVPIEFKDDFLRDVERARRDLGSIPSKSVSPFFNITERPSIYRATNLEIINPIDENGILTSGFVCNDQNLRFIHVDLAKTKDAAGLSMCHIDRMIKVGTEEVPHVKFDLLLQVKAHQVGGEIKFSKIRELIYILQRRKFKLGYVTYDGWQSVDSIQILKDQGIDAGTRSVDRTREPYETLKTFINTDRVEFPLCFGMPPYQTDVDGERIPIISYELINLEDLKGKIDHPIHGSKDVSDSAAGALMNAIENYIDIKTNNTEDFGFDFGE